MMRLILLIVAMLAAMPACAALFVRGGGAPTSYQGECDIISGGCAEAWDVHRAATVNYSGNLLQIENTTNSETLNIGQTAGHAANMSGVASFCGSGSDSGGITTYSSCVITIIYAQIQGSANNLVPSVFESGPGSPSPPWLNCTAGGNTCACVFASEDATGLPIFQSTVGCEYTLASDQAVTGVTSGAHNISMFYEGKAVLTAQGYFCCGQIGIGHAYNAGDTIGTDFYPSVSYGFNSATYVENECETSSTYCSGLEEESIGDWLDYSASNIGSVFTLAVFNSSANQISAYINGGQLRSPIEPAAALCSGCGGLVPGKSIHLGGGGDLGQPANATMRGFAISNNALTSTDDTNLYNNVTAFDSGLTFTNYSPPSTAVSVVQTAPGTSDSSSGATSISTTFSNPTGTTKHGVVVALFWCGPGPCSSTTSDVISSVSAGTNSCSEVSNSFAAAGGRQTEIWACPNLASAASTVTATTNGTSVSYFGIMAEELDCPTSGCVVDQGGESSTNSQYYCFPFTNGNTAQNGEFLYSVAAASSVVNYRGIGLNTSLNAYLQDEYTASGSSGAKYAAPWLQAAYDGNMVCSVAAIEP